MSYDLAGRFVAQTTSPLARSVAATVPDLRPAVLAHPELQEDLWFTLYRTPKLPSAADARQLVSRVLSDAQIRFVIERESRSKVVVAMLEANVLTAAQLDLLTTSKACTAPVADKLLDTQPETLSLDWLREAGLKAGGKALLEYFCQAPADLLSDTEIGEHLARYTEWGPTWATSRLLRLINARPGVIPAALSSGHQKLATVIAGTRHITDLEVQYTVAGLRDPQAANPTTAWLDEHVWTWIALVWNPVTSLEVIRALDPMLTRQQAKPDAWYAAETRLGSKPNPVTVPFDEVTEPRQLTWLIQRTLSKPRADDFGVLVANPNLGPGEADRLLHAPLHHDHKDAFLAVAAPGTQVHIDLLALAARFPDVVGGNYAEELAQTRAELFGRSAASGPASPPEADLPPLSVEAQATAGSRPIDALRWDRAAREHFERAVADTPDAWAFALNQMDDFPGTVDDFLQVVNAVAAVAA